jgi:predicted RNA methylase
MRGLRTFVPQFSTHNRKTPRRLPSSWVILMLTTKLAYIRESARGKAQRLSQTYHENGFLDVVRRLKGYGSWILFYRKKSAAFDRKFNVDTKGCIPLWCLTINSENVQQGVRYEAVDPIILRRALTDIDENFQKFTFVDIGCGKGRALLIASEYGFSTLMGVDFASELVAIARNNCEGRAISATISCSDAARFQFPSGRLVVYLFNPFGATVLDDVLENILASDCVACYVVYVNPKHCECLARQSRMRCVVHREDYVIWQLMPKD